MAQTITDDLAAILKSRLQAGATGFRGEIEIDYLVDASAGTTLADLAFAVGSCYAHCAVESGSVTWAHATISGYFGVYPVDGAVDEIFPTNPGYVVDGSDATASVRNAVVLRGAGTVATYWEVDLGAPYEIVSFRGVVQEGRTPSSIDFSDDGVTWTAAALGAYAVSGWTWYVDLAAPASHRLWRLRFVDTTDPGAFDLWFWASLAVYEFGIVGYGATPARHVTQTYRVATLNYDRSRKMAAAQLDALFENEDGSKGWYFANPLGGA